MATSGKILLIDDDAIFCKILQKIAAKDGIELDCYESLSDMGNIGLVTNYDAAILDVNLGCVNGDEIAKYLNSFFSSMPVYLVSSTHYDDEQEQWTPNVIKFIDKEDVNADFFKALAA